MPRRQTPIDKRGGYTVIELLVSIAVISILIALLLPAVQSARAAARRTQCKNNLRNIGLALVQVAETQGRFPASGNYGWNASTSSGQNHHTWVLDVLPYLEQASISDRWDKDRPITDPQNEPLMHSHVPVLTCPDDISVTGDGDLTYVVNGGIGFTVRYHNGVRDCPVDQDWKPLDLNGNGFACSSSNPNADGYPTDKDHFWKMGMFFLETWGDWEITRRHHRFGSVTDGLSNTILASENVRAGRDPSKANQTWANPNPYGHSFYIGNPCENADCSPGNVDYNRSNAGKHAINSGLASPEGSSPVPNAFHPGGVHMAFGDGRVQFISETISGPVYAALASPQGGRLSRTPLAQPIVGDGDY